MKKLLLAGIAAAAFSGAPALAGPPPASYSWTGCYIGASAGGAWGNAAIDNNFAVGFPANHVRADPNGFVGGGQMGCDYQNSSNWLIGLQGEFNWSNAHGHQTVFPPFPYVSETLDASVDWYASVTARLGYVSGPWLFYGKGGVAWVRDPLKDVGLLASSSFEFSGNITRVGWTIGGGLEYAIAPNWSASFEYGYYGFGTKSVTLSGSTTAPGLTLPGSESIPLNQNFSVVKVGLNYRFSTGH